MNKFASKLGSGQFNNVYGRNGSYITAGQQDYVERLSQIEQPNMLKTGCGIEYKGGKMNILREYETKWKK